MGQRHNLLGRFVPWWRWWGIGNRKRFRRVFLRKLSNPSGFSSIYHFRDGVRKAPFFGASWTPWWRWWDSNPWPPACRAGALPAELHPQIEVLLFLPVKSSLLRSKNFTLTKSKFHCRRQFHFGFAKISPRNLKVSPGRPKWTRTTLITYPSFHSGKAACALLRVRIPYSGTTGRPKWTRTTDLVLIRHAL